jgi:predicted neuraminidase
VKCRILSKAFVYEQDRWFPTCHASTVCRLREGGYLCASFAGRFGGGIPESDMESYIYLARSADGVTFSDPHLIRTEHKAHWNPVLDAVRDGYVLYFKSCFPQNAMHNWKTYVCRSADGERWDEPAELVPGDISGGRGPTKNPVLHWNGMLIAGRSLEGSSWTVENDVSFDNGKTWHTVQPLDYKYDEVMAQSYRLHSLNGLIQPTLWADGDGVHMFMRSTWGAVYRSDSTDGLNWCPAYRTDIPNNNSGVCAAYRDGLLALCFNPVVSTTPTQSMRSPLVMDFSSDGGKTFGDRIVLEDEPADFSYPTVIADDEGFTVSYTWKRKNLALVRIAVG